VELGLYGKRIEARTLREMIDVLGRLEGVVPSHLRGGTRAGEGSGDGNGVGEDDDEMEDDLGGDGIAPGGDQLPGESTGTAGMEVDSRT
jgi:hypothetical protein